MRVNKLVEEKLNEFRDFCRYGHCLEEETAKEYLKFLVNGIKNITNRYKTISADSAHKINDLGMRELEITELMMIILNLFLAKKEL